MRGSCQYMSTKKRAHTVWLTVSTCVSCVKPTFGRTTTGSPCGPSGGGANVSIRSVPIAAQMRPASTWPCTPSSWSRSRTPFTLSAASTEIDTLCSGSTVRILAIVDSRSGGTRFARKSIAIVASFACEEICDLRRLNEGGCGDSQPSSSITEWRAETAEWRVLRDGESISVQACERVWLVHEDRAQRLRRRARSLEL